MSSGSLAIHLITPFIPVKEFSYVQIFLEKEVDQLLRHMHSHLRKVEENDFYARQGQWLHTWPNVSKGSYRVSIFLLDADLRCIANHTTIVEKTGNQNYWQPITIEERVPLGALKVFAPDIELDEKSRRGTESLPESRRRAIVHNFDDGLTFNWDKDYPGGLTFKGDAKFTESVTFESKLHVLDDILLYTAAVTVGRDTPVPSFPISLRATLNELNSKIRALEARIEALERQ
jgi:hypothetical protein